MTPFYSGLCKSGNFTCTSINGYGIGMFSLTTHNHDDKYAAIDHTHSEYSLSTHNHDEDYAAIDHTHTEYSLTTHNHDSAYAAIDHTHSEYSLNTHNHDDKYAAIDHTHTEYSLNTHNHDDKYAAIDHTHNFDYLNFNTIDISNNKWQQVSISQEENKIVFSIPQGTNLSPPELKDFYIDRTVNNLCINKPSYNDIQDLPSTFTPAEHTHSYSSLTNIPSTFTPAEHTHWHNDIMFNQNSALQIGRFLDFIWGDQSSVKDDPYTWRIASYEN